MFKYIYIYYIFTILKCILYILKLFLLYFIFPLNILFKTSANFLNLELYTFKNIYLFDIFCIFILFVKYIVNFEHCT